MADGVSYPFLRQLVNLFLYFTFPCVREVNLKMLTIIIETVQTGLPKSLKRSNVRGISRGGRGGGGWVGGGAASRLVRMGRSEEGRGDRPGGQSICRSTDYSQNVPKSKRPRIGQNVPKNWSKRPHGIKCWSKRPQNNFYYIFYVILDMFWDVWILMRYPIHRIYTHIAC